MTAGGHDELVPVPPAGEGLWPRLHPGAVLKRWGTVIVLGALFIAVFLVYHRQDALLAENKALTEANQERIAEIAKLQDFDSQRADDIHKASCRSRIDFRNDLSNLLRTIISQAVPNATVRASTLASIDAASHEIPEDCVGVTPG